MKYGRKERGHEREKSQTRPNLYNITSRIRSMLYIVRVFVHYLRKNWVGYPLSEFFGFLSDNKCTFISQNDSPTHIFVKVCQFD